jgi:hypothetical protein
VARRRRKSAVAKLRAKANKAVAKRVKAAKTHPASHTQDRKVSGQQHTGKGWPEDRKASTQSGDSSQQTRLRNKHGERSSRHAKHARPLSSL